MSNGQNLIKQTIMNHMSYFFDQNGPTSDLLTSQKSNITSLNQLSQIYGGKSPHEIAQSVVYGQKVPKPQTQVRMAQSSQSFVSSSEASTTKCRSPPSKLTILSQQLYNYVPLKIETGKSSRAFHNKDQHLLLSPERLRSMPSPLNKPMTDVTNRLTDFQCVAERRKEDLKEKFVQQEMSACTFQPQIDVRSKNMIRKMTAQDVRSVEQFNEDQVKHVTTYQSKKEQAQEKRDLDEVLLLQDAPKLSLKSEKLASIRFGTSSVVDRLFCISPSKQTVVSISQDKQLDPMCSFHPEISSKSKNMKRQQPVNEFLFQDAQKRRDKKEQTLLESQQQLTSHGAKGSDASVGWFVQRFIKEFYFQLSGLERIKKSEQKDFSRLTYSETLQVLQGLNYLKSVQYFSLQEDKKQQLANLWQHLAPQDPPAPSVLSRNLLVVLLAILAVPIQHTQIPHYRPHQHHEDDGASIGESDVLFRRAEFLQPDNEDGILNINKPRRSTKQLPRDANGNINLTAFDSQYLHQTFYDLYLNSKQLSHGNGTRRQQARSPSASGGRLQSPTISQNSLQLSTNKRMQVFGKDRDFDIHEWFQLQEAIKAQNREHTMQQVKDQELKECNFGKNRAQQCTINLQEFARPHQKLADRKPQDIDFERQNEECTFQPKISASRSSQQLPQTTLVAQQISKNADRLKEARVRKQALQALKDKGSTTNNKSRGQSKRLAQNQENKSKQTKGPKSLPMNKIHKSKTEGSDQFDLGSSRKRQDDDNDDAAEMEQQQQQQQRFSKDRPDEERIPLLFVDVNIEEGKTARIVVFDGDKSDDLVDKFSREYNLDDSMRLKLKELLDLQINNLLTKIEEDFQEESDQDLQE